MPVDRARREGLAGGDALATTDGAQRATTDEIIHRRVHHFFGNFRYFVLAQFIDSELTAGYGGGVPIALQRWEYLGRKDAVHRLDAFGSESATVPQ